LSVTRVDHPGIEETRSFFPGKNVETTVRAFSLCRDRFPHKLVIAGRRVKDYLVFMGLSDRELEDVVFLDFVPHEEMPALYNLADLFVIPSYYESYAQAMVEAMRCGCPVIASKTGACPEISGGAALLANPDDPQDFADKISLVLTEEKIRRELSVKSLNRSTSFDWEMTARIVLDKLTEVIQH
jgi:glycosyltransferase involved in cell wall biosynthesis